MGSFVFELFEKVYGNPDGDCPCYRFILSPLVPKLWHEDKRWQKPLRDSPKRMPKDRSG